MAARRGIERLARLRATQAGRERPLFLRGNFALGRERQFDALTSRHSVGICCRLASQVLERPLWRLRHFARMMGYICNARWGHPGETHAGNPRGRRCRLSPALIVVHGIGTQQGGDTLYQCACGL